MSSSLLSVILLDLFEPSATEFWLQNTSQRPILVAIKIFGIFPFHFVLLATFMGLVELSATDFSLRHFF